MLKGFSFDPEVPKLRDIYANAISHGEPFYLNIDTFSLTLRELRQQQNHERKAERGQRKRQASPT
jgi:hypothetical protein